MQINKASIAVRCPRNTPNRVSIAMAVLSAVSTAGVLVGFFPLAYAYYMLLRVVLCLTAVYGIALALGCGKGAWLWVFGLLAVLYNPVLPVHLGWKPAWVVLNGATVVLFWLGVYLVRHEHADTLSRPDGIYAAPVSDDIEGVGRQLRARADENKEVRSQEGSGDT
jgi:hypothetical protein